MVQLKVLKDIYFLAVCIVGWDGGGMDEDEELGMI